MASNSFSATPTSTPAPPQSTGGEREKKIFNLSSLCSIGGPQRIVIALNICEVGDFNKKSAFRFPILAVLHFPTFSAFAILLFLSVLLLAIVLKL